MRSLSERDYGYPACRTRISRSPRSPEIAVVTVRHDEDLSFTAARSVQQRVWFEGCVGLTPRQELGLVDSPQQSFQLDNHDTIASVTAAHRRACATARAVVARLPLDTVVTGHHEGPRTLRWVYLQVGRELAQHCGHADTLREQVLAD